MCKHVKRLCCVIPRPSWLPLAARASSRNLAFAFLTCLCIGHYSLGACGLVATSRNQTKSKVSFSTSTHLHHQKNGVEYDECHNEVLERRRHNHPPDLVLQTVHLFRHVALQRLGLDGEVDARFLSRQINNRNTYTLYLLRILTSFRIFLT